MDPVDPTPGADPTPPTASAVPVPMTTTAVVVPPVPATTDPVVTARRLSRVGIAALLASTRAARDAVGADDEPGRAADISLGSVAIARETTLAAARAAAETGGRVASGTAARLDPVVRGLERLPGLGGLVAAGRSSVGSTLEALAEAGRAERHQAATTGSAAVQRTVGALGPETIDLVLPVVVGRIAADPALLAPVVTQVLDGLAEEPEALGPVVDAALARLANDPERLLGLITAIIDPVVAIAIPAALDRLTDDPDQIRNLILDQSGGLADEMANSFRARLVSADDAVNRLTDKLTGRARRQRRQASAPAPAGGTADGKATA